MNNIIVNTGIYFDAAEQSISFLCFIQILWVERKVGADHIVNTTVIEQV